MGTMILLLAMVAFVVWACRHTHVHTNWYRDEVEGEAFIAALRAPAVVTSDGVWLRPLAPRPGAWVRVGDSADSDTVARVIEIVRARGESS